MVDDKKKQIAPDWQISPDFQTATNACGDSYGYYYFYHKKKPVVKSVNFFAPTAEANFLMRYQDSASQKVQAYLDKQKTALPLPIGVDAVLQLNRKLLESIM